MPPKAGTTPKSKKPTQTPKQKQDAAKLLAAFEEKAKAKKEAALAAQREYEEEQAEQRRLALLTPSKRAKSPGRRSEPDALTRTDTASKHKESVDETNIHNYALNGEEDKLRQITNLHQDKEGKNYIRFLNSRDRHGNTALMNACWKGHLSVVRFLVESGASINLQNYYGWTAMMWAVSHDAIRVVEFLLEKGADLHIITPVGRTAVEFALDPEIKKKIQAILDKPVAVPKELAKLI